MTRVHFNRSLIGAGIGLALVLAVAFWLRWQYVQTISLYVDEFTTLWAAKRVLATGLPIMPSGVLYTRGLLASYLTAGVAAVGGLTYTTGRLLSVFFGLAAIVTVWWVGRKSWNGRVGWLAALGLALLPEAIIWSSRARFYAQLQFFVLLLLWVAYLAIRPGRAKSTIASDSPSPTLYIFFTALFILALFSQEQTILLYPPILLATVLWRGWRYLLQPTVRTAHFFCIGAMAVRYLIEIVGQPGFFETIQAERPYVGFIFDLPTAWAAYADLLVTPARLPWTLGMVLAICVALMGLAARRWRLLELEPFHQATLFFGLQFVFVLGFILTLVGGQWRDARYLYLVQPCWLLTGAAGAVWLADRLQRPALRAVATAGLALLLLVPLWQPAQAAITHQVEGYDRVLAYVAAHREPGDVTMSPQPPACALVLGPCDYYAAQVMYEEFVVPKDGVLVDRWSGARLLKDAQELRTVLQSAPRAWLVSDGFRLATRYDADFLRTVIENFDSVDEERGVLALLAAGVRPQPAYTVTTTLTVPARLGPLALLSWQRTEPFPGKALSVNLVWQGAEPIDRQLNTSVRVVGVDGVPLVQADGPPARGILPTNLFFTTPLPDPKTFTLPVDLPPGRYRLDVVAYDVTTAQPVADPYTLDWFAIGDSSSPPQVQVDAAWQDGLALVGHDVLPTDLTPGGTLNLRLVWAATEPISGDYTRFAHLEGPDGAVVAQADAPPGGAFYPTSGWEAGEWVEDTLALALPPTLAPGKYALRVGLYELTLGERLPTAAGGDAVNIGVWELP